MINDIGRSISAMDLTQFASFGEFVGGVGSALGAIAVLATLIHLNRICADFRRADSGARPSLFGFVASQPSRDAE